MTKIAVDFSSKINLELVRTIFRSQHPGVIHVHSTLDQDIIPLLRKEADLAIREMGLFTGSNIAEFSSRRYKLPLQYRLIKELSDAYLRDIYNPLGQTQLNGAAVFPGRSTLEKLTIRRYDRLFPGSENFHGDSGYINLVGILTISGSGRFSALNHIDNYEIVFDVKPGSLVLMRQPFKSPSNDLVWHKFMLSENEDERIAAVFRITHNVQE